MKNKLYVGIILQVDEYVLVCFLENFDFILRIFVQWLQFLHENTFGC